MVTTVMRDLAPAALPRLLSTRGRAVAMMVVLATANGLVWAWTWSTFRDSSGLLATALLAYGLGLRHAVDADHIAAIDNATRKMMESGKRPVTRGFWPDPRHCRHDCNVSLRAGTLPGVCVRGWLRHVVPLPGDDLGRKSGDAGIPRARLQTRGGTQAGTWRICTHPPYEAA